MNLSIRHRALCAGWLAGGLLACAATPAKDPARAALEASIARHEAAIAAGDVNALNATLTDDVELLDGGSSVAGRGRAARKLLASGAYRLRAASREIVIAGDLAWRIVGLTRSEKNGIVEARGQALEIWKRIAGEWRLHRRLVADANMPDIPLTRPPADQPVLDKAGR